MDENPYMAPRPYKAPKEIEPGKPPVTIRRRIAVVLIIPCCVLIAGFFFIIIAYSTIETIAHPRLPFRWKDVLPGGIFGLLNGLTWSVTAWAIWTNRSRAAIAAFCADIVAFATLVAAVNYIN